MLSCSEQPILTHVLTTLCNVIDSADSIRWKIAAIPHENVVEREKAQEKWDYYKAQEDVLWDIVTKMGISRQYVAAYKIITETYYKRKEHYGIKSKKCKEAMTAFEVIVDEIIEQTKIN